MQKFFHRFGSACVPSLVILGHSAALSLDLASFCGVLLEFGVLQVCSESSKTVAKNKK